MTQQFKLKNTLGFNLLICKEYVILCVCGGGFPGHRHKTLWRTLFWVRLWKILFPYHLRPCWKYGSHLGVKCTWVSAVGQSNQLILQKCQSCLSFPGAWLSCSYCGFLPGLQWLELEPKVTEDTDSSLVWICSENSLLPFSSLSPKCVQSSQSIQGLS